MLLLKKSHFYIEILLFFTLISYIAITEIKADEKPKPEDLIKIEKQLAIEKKESQELEKKAVIIGQEIAGIRQKMIATAKKVQNQEENLSGLETKLADLKQEQQTITNKLTKKNEQMTKVIAILQNIALKPAEMIVVQPLEPIDLIRSVILMSDSIPYIESSVNLIKEDLKKLASLRANIQAQYSRISLVKHNLEQEHNEIKKLHQQRLILKKTTETESQLAAVRAKKLAEQADDLRDLLKALANEKQIRASLKRTPTEMQTQAKTEVRSFDQQINFAQAKGRLSIPVRGSIITVYGEVTKTGSHAKGITIKTRSHAQVTAPFDGTVLFADVFRGYGPLLIIEHNGGYHTLMAGMEHIEVDVNQNLLAGEPIGTMPKDQEPNLYLEIRKNGHPVNPSPWFVSNNNDGIS